MKKYVFFIIFCLLFIGIIIFNYEENYKFRIKPPSEDWSKEVLIESQNGCIKTYPKMLDYMDESYLIAYQNGMNIKVELIDKIGRKKNEITIPVGDEFIWCLNLLGDGNNIYINWITSNNSIKTMNSVKLDSNLKITGQSNEKDVIESTQIGNNVLVTTFKDSIVLTDINSNIKTEKKAFNPKLVSGTNTNKGYLVTYHEDGKKFKYFFIKDGTASDTDLAVAMVPDSKGGYFDRTTLSSDNKYAYLMVETKNAFDRFGKIKCITFSLDGKEKNVKDLRVGPFREIFGSVEISSGDKARFIASCTRDYERKNTQEDIIDFTLKNGEVTQYSFASRTNQPSMYPAFADNNLIFFNYLDTDKYDIYMASMDNEFKSIYNIPRSSEKNRALSDTFTGFMYSIVFTFLIGLKWIVFSLCAICCFSYFAHTMSSRGKKITYILCYFVLAVIKVSTIYSKRTQFPGLLNSSVFVIGLCTFISILCLLYGYGKYKNDMDALPLWSYVQAMLIDTLLTQMIFIPYLY